MTRVFLSIVLLAGSIANAEPVRLDQMPADAKYKGETAGLYGEGRNDPPEALAKLAQANAAKVAPIDGKIGFISIGMSNTHLKFQAFMKKVQAQKSIDPALVLVDGAQGGRDAGDWARPQQDKDARGASPWVELDRRLAQANLKPEQVQVIWMLHARAQPQRLGQFPRHADVLADNMQSTLDEAKRRFVNLRLVYLSSRSYAGYARGQLNPEPYAYESAFAVRKVVLGQKPDVTGPAVLWGPYFWRDATFWKPDDFRNDGTHPSPAGANKAAGMMLEFFRTDPTAKPWFTVAE